jgi:redox-sensing transcriptional repressor
MTVSAMDNQEVFKGVPEPSLRRLPIYNQYLKNILAEEKNVVSCTQIAEALGLTPIQVRKDLEVTGVAGKPKVGYQTDVLIKAIENFLGWDNAADAFLIGAGNLGLALLGYQGFKDYGLNIVAAFDVDKRKIGREFHGKKIFDLAKLEDLTRRMKVKIGILTVPSAQAQAVADTMIAAGIKGIWNFSPYRISVREGVIVQHENLASSLAVLSKRLSTALKTGMK